MANEANLKPFGPDNPPPANRGRPKGSKNRSTLLKKWLAVAVKGQNGEQITVEDQVVLALISKALQGDVPATKEILDTVYGKTVDKLETVSLTEDISVKSAILKAIQDGANEADMQSKLANDPELSPVKHPELWPSGCLLSCSAAAN